MRRAWILTNRGDGRFHFAEEREWAPRVKAWFAACNGAQVEGSVVGAPVEDRRMCQRCATRVSDDSSRR